jgi:hypothetical protein
MIKELSLLLDIRYILLNSGYTALELGLTNQNV